MGHVYRSGHPGELPEEVRAEVRRIGLRTVVTFQTRREIEILGDPLAGVVGEVEWEHIPIGDRWFEAGNPLFDDVSSQGEFYVAMVRDHPEHWVRFLRVFTAGHRFPVLYHCTAGRDRTGVATVLLLESLRVPRAAIVADYLVSNEVFQENVQEAEVLDPLFAAIDAAGGIDRFLLDFGLESREIEAVRSSLLTAGR